MPNMYDPKCKNNTHINTIIGVSMSMVKNSASKINIKGGYNNIYQKKIFIISL